MACFKREKLKLMTDLEDSISVSRPKNSDSVLDFIFVIEWFRKITYLFISSARSMKTFNLDNSTSFKMSY